MFGLSEEIMKADTEIDKKLLTNIRKYVSRFIRTHIDLEYHGLKHTESVVHWTQQLGHYERISKRKLALLTIASWFHDTGFAIKYHGHEEGSITLMKDFLKDELDDFDIQFISNCISATHISYEPKNVYEYLIRDADLAHLGSTDYKHWHLRLRSEWESIDKKKYSDFEWYQLNLEFLNKHYYHTLSARILFNRMKRMNMLELERSIKPVNKSITLQ